MKVISLPPSFSSLPSSKFYLFICFFICCYISDCPNCVSSDSDITATPNLLEARGEGGRIRLSRADGMDIGPLQNPPLPRLCFYLSLSLSLSLSLFRANFSFCAAEDLL